MKSKAVILSYKASDRLIEYINNLGIEIILSTKAQVDSRITDHPDLQVHRLDDKTFVIAPELFEYYQEKLGKFDITLIKGEKRLGSIYPYDCSYNVARVGDLFIFNDNVIDPVLFKELENRKNKGIFQKQAYAGCMTIGFDDFAITCDKSIEKALKNEGIEVYYISPKRIKLDGHNIGFLGGSCGIIDNKKVLFTGYLSQLKDFNILMNIFDEKEIEVIYPSCDLVDLGSIISIY